MPYYTDPEVAWVDVQDKPAFADVATTGNYADLVGIPATQPPGDYSLADHTHDGIYATIGDLEGYVPLTQLADYATIDSLAPLATTAEVALALEGYTATADLPTTDLTGYVTTGDLAPYATTSSVATTLVDYPKTSEVAETLQSYALTTDLSVFASSADLSAHDHAGVYQPAGSYATTDQLDGHNHDGRYLKLTGGVLSGNVEVPAQSTVDGDNTHPGENELVTKRITDSRYPLKNHTHSWTSLSGKPLTFPPDTHDHDTLYQPLGEVADHNHNALYQPLGEVATHDHDTLYQPLGEVADHNHSALYQPLGEVADHNHNALYQPLGEVASHNHDTAYQPLGEVASHNHDTAYLKLSGGALTGNVSVPTQSLDPADGTHPLTDELVTMRVTEGRYPLKNHVHTWTSVTDKPEWTDKFTYEDQVLFTDYDDNPPPFNFDITALDSITPTSDDTYNLGQDNKRWRYLYSVYARIKTGIQLGDDPLTNATITYDKVNGQVVFNKELRSDYDGTPSSNTALVNKSYVDTSFANVPVPAWGTLTGKPLWTDKFSVSSGSLRISGGVKNITCVQSADPADSNYPDEYQLISRRVGDSRFASKAHAHDGVYAASAHVHDWDSVTGANKPSMQWVDIHGNESSANIVPAASSPAPIYFLGTSARPWLRTTTNQLAAGAGVVAISVADDLDMEANTIRNLPTPTTDSEPATKSYVDVAEKMNAINAKGLASIRAEQGGGFRTSDSSPVMFIQVAINRLYITGTVPASGTYTSGKLTYTIYSKQDNAIQGSIEQTLTPNPTSGFDITGGILASWQSDPYDSFGVWIKVSIDYDITIAGVVRTINYGSAVLSFDTPVTYPNLQSTVGDF